MRTIVSSSARSCTGCWTCRLRKKKCDEGQPACYSCSSLSLECHGYGPKPKWMDNGPLQQEQAARIKHIVRQRGRSKKRSSTLTSDPLSPEPRSSQTLTIPACDDGLVEVWSNDHIQDFDVTSLDETTWTNLLENNYLSPQVILNPNTVTDPTKADLSMDWEGTMLSTGSGETIFASPCEIADTQEHQDIWDGLESRDEVPNSKALSWTSSSDKENPVEFHLECASPCRIHALGRSQKVALTPGSCGQMMSIVPRFNHLTTHGATEDMLFMHYLDQVFYVQFPFFDARTKRKRGWLLSMLKGVKSAYHASLALSEHHLLSTQCRESESTTSHLKLRSKDSHYYLANQEMERSIDSGDESMCRSRSLERLVCILQLLFLEIFAGGADDWQKYLRTAAGFLPAIIEEGPPPEPGVPKDWNSRHTADRHTRLHPRESEPVNFLLGSFIALDIVSCASTRSTPLLDIDHTLLLETIDVDSTTFMGYDNTIMRLIFEISRLDDWKRHANTSQKLSIIELAKRGSGIEERLHQRMAEIENASPSRLTSNRNSGLMLISAYANISRICALSAIVYLHVVISGAQPELPEVKEGVSGTLAALQSLEDKQLLVHAVWAFCISGSMADGSQQESFRELYLAAEVTHATVGSLREAFKIMETCWEMRRNGTGSCDWVSAMEQLGRYVLLQ